MKIRIENIGKHKHLALDLPAHGAYQLRGPNGAGKTTALDAILAAHRAGDMPAVTWGAIPARGSVEVDGVKATVGGNVRIVGTPIVKVVSLSDVLDLADPGIADAKRAEVARQKRFASLTGAKATPAALLGAEMAGGEMDLPAAAEAARIDANARALEAERKAEALSGRLVGMESTIPAKAPAPTVEEASAALVTARSALDTLTATHAARVAQEARQAKARASHGERPDPSTAAMRHASAMELECDAVAGIVGVPPEPALDAAKTAAEDAYEAAAVAAGNLGVAQVKLADLERQIAAQRESVARLTAHAEAAESTVKAMSDRLEEVHAQHTAWREAVAENGRRKLAAEQARAQVHAAATALADVRDAGRRWDEVAALLAEPVDGASDEDVAAASSALEDARAKLDAARTQATRTTLLETRDRLVAERDAVAEVGKSWRDVAQTGIPSRVAAILAKLDAPGWGIGDGLLCADPDRGGELVPFADLSDGRRLAAAIDLALRGQHDDAILILPQERGSQLDTAAWARLATVANERGVYILSAVLGDGPLELVTVS